MEYRATLPHQKYPRHQVDKCISYEQKSWKSWKWIAEIIEWSKWVTLCQSPTLPNAEQIKRKQTTNERPCTHRSCKEKPLIIRHPRGWHFLHHAPLSPPCPRSFHPSSHALICQKIGGGAGVIPDGSKHRFSLYSLFLWSVVFISTLYLRFHFPGVEPRASNIYFVT